ncbi:glycerol-3-phosphate responsive antiterminator [Agromyces sp. Root1464]|uniref:glycerol-3-phosphate responsive antiterminator n=1 Tax=Agromyces sp. Root1464 TaxID=1736467 RepID=UPI001F284CB9|nr:glycerol-3-phosphate responsive antiterminator [Agromyces sp. Root1464]
MNESADEGRNAVNVLEFPRSLDERLFRNPVVASLYGTESVEAFLAGPCQVAIAANVALPDLEGLVATLSSAGKFVFVNIDNSDGLAQDRGGVEYLRKIGAQGLITTRTMLIQKANQLGMVTMQKVFITDRSTLPRSTNAVRQNRPHLVQLMPWPVIPYIAQQDLAELTPYVAAGFVQSRNDVITALKGGAKAVSTSDVELWSITRR